LVLIELDIFSLVHDNNEFTVAAGIPINIQYNKSLAKVFNRFETNAPTNLPSKLATLIVKSALATNNPKCAIKYTAVLSVIPGIAVFMSRKNDSRESFGCLDASFTTSLSFRFEDPASELVALENAAVIRMRYEVFKNNDRFDLYTLNNRSATAFDGSRGLDTSIPATDLFSLCFVTL
jgi:hypothetical protein